MAAIRAAKLARKALLTEPPALRVNAIVRETLTSGSGAALPSDVVVRAAALTREALLAYAGALRVAAVVREALVLAQPADLALGDA